MPDLSWIKVETFNLVNSNTHLPFCNIFLKTIQNLVSAGMVCHWLLPSWRDGAPSDASALGLSGTVLKILKWNEMCHSSTKWERPKRTIAHWCDFNMFHLHAVSSIHTIELSYLCTLYTVYTFRYLKSDKHCGTFRLYWATHGYRMPNWTQCEVPSGTEQISAGEYIQITSVHSYKPKHSRFMKCNSDSLHTWICLEWLKNMDSMSIETYTTKTKST